MTKFNVCLIKPENYIHSYAFLELGELLYFSLKELGFEAGINFNRIEPSQKNILIGCHLLNPNLIPQLPATTIVLNTEQISSDQSPLNAALFPWVHAFEVWDYSKRNIEKLNDVGISRVKHFQIGFQNELARLQKQEDKDIDVLFYGCINERRKYILDKLVEKGLKVKTLFGVYGKERDEWVTRSKVVLNLHFYNSEIFEIVRVFYLLTNSIAVIGEVNKTTSIDAIYSDGIYTASYDELVEKCMEVVASEVLRKNISESAIASISKYPQRIFTEKLLSL